MSGDHPATSFGDPNAQPPTPKQTPTSAVFPSPVFQTPKTGGGRPDDASSGWTPRFAEEFSVFNATPGNLRAARAPSFSGSVVPPSPWGRGAAELKRQLSVEGFAQEIAAHANLFSSDPSIPLPPVDPSRRLPSSPDPLNVPQEYSDQESDSARDHRSAKKARLGATPRGKQTQTATPPPSSQSRGRKLAPKLRSHKMNDDLPYLQPDYTSTQDLSFITPGNDSFNYPMSAPVMGSPSFWDSTVSGMDLDYSASNVFQTPTPSNRQLDSYDWSQEGHLLQDAESVPPSSNQENENVRPAKRERPLAPRATPASAAADAPEAAATSIDVAAFKPSLEDPFMMNSGIVPSFLQRGPQPDLERPSINHRPASMTESISRPSHQGHPNAALSGAIRRAVTVTQPDPRPHGDRASASSPIKPSVRTGLQRSFSEARGKKLLSRGTMPSLTAQGRPMAQASASGAGRSMGSKPSGRSSPLKSHRRQSSIGSSRVPSSAPRTRTSVKFTIDANGRARAETTLVVDEPTPTGGVGRRRLSRDSLQREVDWEASDDDSSSTDDEPIIIPSRPTSFALPDSRQPTSSIFHTSKRNTSNRRTSTYATMPGDSYMNASQHDDSEAETVTTESQGGAGADARGELLKVVETRQKRISQPGSSHRPHHGSVGFPGYQRSLISPTSTTNSSAPTPSTLTRNQRIRCTCHRNTADTAGDGFLVQCESCEMLLHGSCVNITRRTQPTVYICAFCANTPNMRGGRMRDGGRAPGGGGPGPGLGPGVSPLARKSLKSLR